LPSSGTVTPGTKLEVAYFRQLHDDLDESRTVRENVAEGREMISLGEGQKHIVGYLQDFLFSADQIQGPITKLSGGERRRLQLAKMLARPCNVLVLDEPTNDLDLETLELLEDMLSEYAGTLLVVSHDRVFLDNVATSTLVPDGSGGWQEYVGGYQDWVRQRPKVEAAGSPKAAKGEGGKKSDKPRRASFKEKRDLAELPGRIEKLESEKQQLFEMLAQPSFYTERPADVAPTKARLEAIEGEIATAFERWMELEALVSGGEA
jgi:ATP-binding cassette subfamily F protein uup